MRWRDEKGGAGARYRRARGPCVNKPRERAAGKMVAMRCRSESKSSAGFVRCAGGIAGVVQFVSGTAQWGKGWG